MFFDTNIYSDGIDEEFLDELDEFIEDSRVEYFLIHPKTIDELEKVKNLTKQINRFKYSIPFELLDLKDENCVAVFIRETSQLDLIENSPVIISSNDLNVEFVKTLNEKKTKGVILDAKESDKFLENFVFSISQTSVKQWTQLGMKDTDYNKLALQSDFPKYSYDDFFDLLKIVSDMTFRAEQSIASGGTRTLLKTFSLI